MVHSKIARSNLMKEPPAYLVDGWQNRRNAFENLDLFVTFFIKEKSMALSDERSESKDIT